MNKSKQKNIAILFGITTILCLCCFLPNILSHLPLKYGTDLTPEQVFFVEEFNRMWMNFFKTGTLPFYSWTLFLGNNYYASQSFYGNADIFNFLGLFLQNINFLDRTLILEILKLYVASFTMYAYLSEFHFKEPIKFIGSICFAFSSWAIFFSGQLMFLSFYCFMPLYFLGIERYLKYQKFGLFMFSIVLLAFTNWYFLYTISVFTPIYYIYRYYLLRDSFKSFIKETLKLIGIYLLSLGITMIYFLPTILYMTGNSRVGEIGNPLFFKSVSVYLHQLVAMFVPNYMYIYGNNVFETGWHVSREICLWASGLVALFSLQVLAIKEEKYAKASRILYIVMILIFIIPIGNSMMHGFSEPSFRWTLLFIFINILNACYALEHKEDISNKFFTYCTIGAVIIILISIPLASLITGNAIQEYGFQIMIFLCSAVFLLIYFLLYKKQTKNLYKYLLIIVTVEIGISSTSLYITKLNHDENGTYEFQKRVTHVLENNRGDLKNYLNGLEPENTKEYFRTYVDLDKLYWSYSHNMASIYQINGLMTYDSTYAPSFNKMQEIAPQVLYNNYDLVYSILDPTLITFLNTKYALVLAEEDLPEGVNWTLIDDSYLDFVQVYKNEDYQPLGRSIHKIETYENRKSLDELLDTIICEEGDISTIQSSLTDEDFILTDIRYENNLLTGTINSHSGGFMLLTLPYDEGWTVFINGNKVNTYDINAGFIGFFVPSGDNYIEMYFTPKGFKAGAIISILSIGFTILLMGYQLIKKRKQKRI